MLKWNGESLSLTCMNTSKIMFYVHICTSFKGFVWLPACLAVSLSVTLKSKSQIMRLFHENGSMTKDSFKQPRNGVNKVWTSLHTCVCICVCVCVCACMYVCICVCVWGGTVFKKVHKASFHNKNLDIFCRCEIILRKKKRSFYKKVHPSLQ